MLLRWIRTTSCAALLVLFLAPAAVFGNDERTEPLVVPHRAVPGPETGAARAPRERIESAVEGYLERGYRELPVFAWALLRVSDSESAVVKRAVELAPSSPAVRFEAARMLIDPAELVRALRSVRASFPAIVWLITVAGAALGGGLVLAIAVLALLAFIRAAALHGHVIGHLTYAQDPPAWPGVLLVIAGLALLPLAGVGPALIVAALGLLAAVRLGRRDAVTLGVGLALAGLLLGPALDGWARFGALLGRDPELMVAWRTERAQPFPGDRERLEVALDRRPEEMLLRLALATAWLREGDLQRAEGVLADLPVTASAPLLARADNLRGSIALARGELESAISAFEAARATEESAAVLYNLSQAYGRAVRLHERATFFEAARDLDPELVTRYTAFDGANLHHYLIQQPAPLADYMRRGAAPAAEAEELARTIREWTFGPRMPDFAWLVLPFAGILGAFLRRSGIRRCTRCERPVCDRCLGDDTKAAMTCVRCVRLFARGANADPRMRKMQLELDRRRQRRTARLFACLALVAPGVGRILEGRMAGGAATLVFVGIGFACIAVAHVLVAPFELGALGSWLVLGVAGVLVPPTYIAGALEAKARFGAVRTRG